MIRRAIAIASTGLALALTLTVTRIAHAETVSVDTSSVTRINPDNSAATMRLVNGSYQGVGYGDCTGNTSFVFNVAIGDFSSSTVATYDLEAWVGTGDCTQLGATHAGTATCWPVIMSLTPSTPVAITVRVEDLVSGIGIPTAPQAYTAATTNSCDTAQNALSTSTSTTLDDAGDTITTSGQATLNIFFMLFPIGGATMPAAASPAYPVIVDFSTPNPATSVTALPGSTELTVSWVASPDTDIAGYNVYSALTTADAGCDNTVNIATATLTVVTGATTTTVSGLVNGSSYDVAVAAFDSFGNVSALTSVACGTPSTINDFWTTYNESGGNASSCTLGAQGAPAASILGAVSGLTGGLALLRRRKKRGASEQKVDS